ncbi:NfeD family protein [Microlunatus elymi]|uniref:NfeD family protein n=2 Tax=Microlunatus elymi TaxID=2596828 RepID=A0A516Q5Q6_9ACTN|nr:NfeD family protein [Microlunatus elymi]
MQAWMIWLAVAAGLGFIELAAMTLDFALLAVAALAAAGVAALGLPIGLQFVAFFVVAILMVLLVRPVARRHLTRTPAIPSGTAALVGKSAVTLTEVGRDTGRVKIGGEEWSARAYDADLVIPQGTTVDVFAIEGATALVYPQEAPWLH